MKKSRWTLYHEMKDRIRKTFTPEEIKQLEVNEPERIRANTNAVCVPKDLLVDGVFDGKFKRANQRKLAKILGITIKQDLNKN